ncbi:RNA polymerase sigma factor for flagellar operon FliA [Variovorax sp. PDC80]|uniref:sigma-70 family RNA polymerase sigma factor n=1 Tax=Variovorax sp. PDC80 TaxID=1882827 RepID=UPI0008F24A9F|nr:sigma-70 family RNA polymerase sigma factor [Variovorax sp. PDC80]SFO54238.1 RNA polymerase sigma factor for flagellar operon FliA [Variovorax sp. PDC80]
MPRFGSALTPSLVALPATGEAGEHAPGGGMGANDDTLPLWQRWRDRADPEARELLIGHYLPYARMMAATLYGRRTHDEVEFADYLQYARVGLLEAIDRYDPTQGAQFKTFAARRVQGAMLNGLASFTEKNQQISVRMRLRQERLEAVKQAAAEAAPDDAPATASSSPSRSADALFRYLAEVGIGLALGVMLEDTGMVDAQAFDGEAHAPSPEVSYFRKSEIDRLRSVVRSLVDRLGEQQRTVIRHHYLQEVPFDDIAAMMGVTRGRVSQLHRQALLRLRELLSADARLDVSL